MTSPIDPVLSGSSNRAQPPAPPPPQTRHWFVRLLMWLFGLAVAGAATLALLVLVALSVAYPNLPDVTSLQNYQPKLPLRIYSSEGNLISEFGEERRSYVPFDEIPKVMLICVVEDKDKEFVIKTIMESARTGTKGAFGDGKIFVSPVEEMYTISSGVKES